MTPLEQYRALVEPDYDIVPAQAMKIRRRDAIIRLLAGQFRETNDVLEDFDVTWGSNRDLLSEVQKEFGE